MRNIILNISVLVMLSGLTTMTFALEKKSATFSVIHHQLPVLVNKKHNPVMTIAIDAAPGVGLRIDRLMLDFTGTSRISDIRAVRLFRFGPKLAFDTTAMVGIAERPSLKQEIYIDSSVSGAVRLWVSLELAPKTDLLHVFRIACKSITTGNGVLTAATTVGGITLRAGLAIRRHMDDGVHTYRIPGLTTTKQGTLLAVYDARRASSRDLQGDMDITLNRSTDGGRSWQPMQTVLDMKQWGGLPEKFNGVSDANILADDRTGDIYVAGLWMHGVLDDRGMPLQGLDTASKAWNHQWRNKGSQPGYDVHHTSQFLITKSTDDGKTWGEPVNITSLKDSAWWLFAPAPGHGITLRDGTLVFPTQGRDEAGMSFSNITYSRDGGRSWTVGRPAAKNTTECMAVQLADGGIMLNMRHNANRNDTGTTNGRAVAVTYDFGQTWQTHPTSRNALIEPTCMASIHQHAFTAGGEKKHLMLFSNPNAKTGRFNMTIKASFDDGLSWPKEHWLLLDERNSRGYSCITSIDARTIGILYEGSQADMVFQMIPVKVFTGR
jgi:sialidase-1